MPPFLLALDTPLKSYRTRFDVISNFNPTSSTDFDVLFARFLTHFGFFVFEVPAHRTE